MARFRSKIIAMRILSVLVLFFLALLLYWFMLLQNQNRLRASTLEQLHLRATQTSSALASQTEVMLSGLEHLAHSLAQPNHIQNIESFHQAVQVAFGIFPAETLTQVALADAQGKLIYSSLQGLTPPGAPVYITDREHFRIHLQGTEPQLFISRPLLGRVSQKWTIQFSYPVMQNGQFLGAVVVSVAPDYISNYFRKVFQDEQDVALLLHDDGSYLARSRMQEQALNQRVPADRPFLQNPSLLQGSYSTQTSFDRIERLYAWHRLPNHPLILIAGLSYKNIHMLEQQLREQIVRNLAGTLAILFSSIWAAFLFMRLHENNLALVVNKNRVKLALESSGMSSWSWNMQTDAFIHDLQWSKLLGLEPEKGPLTGTFVRHLVHPEDFQRFRQTFQRYLAGELPYFECEYRIRHRLGHYIHINNRAKFAYFDTSGKPVEVVGVQTDLTRSMAESQLRHALLNNSAAEILLVDSNRCILMANQRAQSRFAINGQELSGQIANCLHLDQLHFAAFDSAYNRLLATRKPISFSYPLKTAQGEQRWFVIHGNLLQPEQEDSNIIWTLLDTTERYQAEAALLAASTQLQAVIENFPGGILVTDQHGNILIGNPRFCQLLAPDLSPGALAQQSLDSLGGQLPQEQADKLHIRPDESSWRDEIVLESQQIISINVISLHSPQQDNGYLWIFYDITHHRQHEQSLKRLAMTDPLTGIANRRAFMEALERCLLHSPGQGALIAIDLDHFKQVNDSYGHAAGDEVLIELARLMQQSLRSSTDLAGRTGGEEFYILLQDASVEGAKRLAERLRSALEQRVIKAGSHCIRVTLSAGIASMATGDSKTVMEKADRALYRAKELGRNQVQLLS